MPLSSNFRTIQISVKWLSLTSHLYTQTLRFIVVKIHIAIFWVLTQCSLIGASR
jgi:hypothetical protein